mmetsp:Transcript_39037/g.78055  ORF Transcript_39037/g.78055 Transcript_39037/m.78055 type:complete len:358 (+) Transcript_39037:1236-2309(+)
MVTPAPARTSVTLSDSSVASLRKTSVLVVMQYVPTRNSLLPSSLTAPPSVLVCAASPWVDALASIPSKASVCQSILYSSYCNSPSLFLTNVCMSFEILLLDAIPSSTDCKSAALSSSCETEPEESVSIMWNDLRCTNESEGSTGSISPPWLSRCSSNGRAASSSASSLRRLASSGIIPGSDFRLTSTVLSGLGGVAGWVIIPELTLYWTLSWRSAFSTACIASAASEYLSPRARTWAAMSCEAAISLSTCTDSARSILHAPEISFKSMPPERSASHELKSSSICLFEALMCRVLRMSCRSSMFCTKPSLFLSISRKRSLTSDTLPLPKRFPSALPSMRGSVDKATVCALASISFASL